MSDGGIIIIDESILLKDLVALIAHDYSFVRIDDEYYTYSADDRLMGTLSHDDIMETYEDEEQAFIRQHIPRPGFICFRCKDYTVFKDCIMAIWDKVDIMLDTDLERMITDKADFALTASFSDFYARAPIYRPSLFYTIKKLLSGRR